MLTLADWGGGAVALAPSGNTDIRWWFNRRVQSIRATSSGFVMTIQDANEFPMPWGPGVLIIINPSATTTFTLRDNLISWSFIVNIGKVVEVSRIKNGSGGATWWPWVRTIK